MSVSSHCPRATAAQVPGESERSDETRRAPRTDSWSGPGRVKAHLARSKVALSYHPRRTALARPARQSCRVRSKSCARAQTLLGAAKGAGGKRAGASSPMTDLLAERCVAERCERVGRRGPGERSGGLLCCHSDDEQQIGGEQEACVGDGGWILVQAIYHQRV